MLIKLIDLTGQEVSVSSEQIIQMKEKIGPSLTHLFTQFAPKNQVKLYHQLSLWFHPDRLPPGEREQYASISRAINDTFAAIAKPSQHMPVTIENPEYAFIFPYVAALKAKAIREALLKKCLDAIWEKASPTLSKDVLFPTQMEQNRIITIKVPNTNRDLTALVFGTQGFIKWGVEVPYFVVVVIHANLGTLILMQPQVTDKSLRIGFDVPTPSIKLLPFGQEELLKQRYVTDPLPENFQGDLNAMLFNALAYPARKDRNRLQEKISAEDLEGISGSNFKALVGLADMLGISSNENETLALAVHSFVDLVDYGLTNSTIKCFFNVYYDENGFPFFKVKLNDGTESTPPPLIIRADTHTLIQGNPKDFDILPKGLPRLSRLNLDDERLLEGPLAIEHRPSLFEKFRTFFSTTTKKTMDSHQHKPS